MVRAVPDVRADLRAGLQEAQGPGVRKIDTEAQPELAQAFNITSIPTLVVIKDRVVLYAEAGALPEPDLENLVSQAREVDMDKVRADIAEHEVSHATAPGGPADGS